jgi:hypothetical protein
MPERNAENSEEMLDTDATSDIIDKTLRDILEDMGGGIALRRAARDAPILVGVTLRDILERPGETARLLSLTPAIGPRTIPAIRRAIVAAVAIRFPDEWAATVAPDAASARFERRAPDGAGVNMQRFRNLWEDA